MLAVNRELILFYWSLGRDILERQNQAGWGMKLVEYALRDTSKPIGVSKFRLTEALPDDLKGTLPTVEELEAELKKTHENAQHSEE